MWPRSEKHVMPYYIQHKLFKLNDVKKVFHLNNNQKEVDINVTIALFYAIFLHSFL